MQHLLRKPAAPMRLFAAVGVLLFLAACAHTTDTRIRELFDRGEYPRVASRVAARLPEDRSNRDYILDRMRLGLALLADGRPAAAEPIMTRTFEMLRTQGINDDKTVAAAILGDGNVIFWKGEPFEQAMMFHYIAVQKALLGEWDNARAASQSSLFLLKDFGENERGGRKTTEEIARTAVQRSQRSDRAFDDYLDHGYTPVKTNFALGYFMNALANLALHRSSGDPARLDEARDNFNEAATLNPSLQPVADALINQSANTVFIIDYGPGPEKVRYGPDDSLTRFAPRLPSDQRPLNLELFEPAIASATPADRVPSALPTAIAADLNALAQDHMWNNFEDIRAAKSTLGTAMLLGGAIAASSRDQTAQIVGLSLLGAGLFSKLTAAADTRHCELLPNRVYVAAANITHPVTTVTLAVAGSPRLALPGIAPPRANRPLALHYVRMPMTSEIARWGQSGRVLYSNDACDCAVPGDDLPYILGGRCVQKPSLEVLRRYQSAGHLLDFSVIDLENLYREEGIDLNPDPRRLIAPRHLLDGGTSLESPVAGSTGFVRLFCQEHPPYSPKSETLRALRASIQPRP
ncbi:MAG: hypothetical protein JNK58_11225 [Phycisphaerae bacterium]|nr:hypothetical protein [Phycisphaerae bacterium]